MTERINCNKIDTSRECPEWCPGLLDSSVVNRNGKSLLIAVCSNPDYFGDEPYVDKDKAVLVFNSRPLIHEEYAQIANSNI